MRIYSGVITAILTEGFKFLQKVRSCDTYVRYSKKNKSRRSEEIEKHRGLQEIQVRGAAEKVKISL